MYILQVIVGFLATISINCDDISSSVQVNPAYDELFADAMRLYNKEDWENALAKFNEAIEDWQNERKYTIECQQKCKNDFKTRTESYSIEYLRYLSFKRNCTSACMLGKMGNRLEVSKHVRRRFDERIPYSYMQYAYHKVGSYLVETFNCRWEIFNGKFNELPPYLNDISNRDNALKYVTSYTLNYNR